MADLTLIEIRELEAAIAAGADLEDKVRRYIKREPDSPHRDGAQAWLDQLSAHLDRLETKVAALQRIRNDRIDRERRILKGMKPGNKRVNFLGIQNYKAAA